MKLLTFSGGSDSSIRLGTTFDGLTVVDLRAAYALLNLASPPDWFNSVFSLLNGGEPAMDMVRGLLTICERRPDVLKTISYAADAVCYYPPASPSAKVICVTINYESHVTPSYSQVAKNPYFFIKFSGIMLPHREPILLSRTSEKCDSEIELVVVIGKRGKYISRANAFDHVAGYTVGNDFSFRDRRTIKSEPDTQRLHWLTLKNLDTAAPIGPWLVTKDEITDPYNLDVKLTLDNEPGVAASGTTKGMIHKIPDLIAEASDGLTLEPGDVIYTGTPLPVAFGMNRYLRDGDILRAEISGIGALVNPTRKEI